MSFLRISWASWMVGFEFAILKGSIEESDLKAFHNANVYLKGGIMVHDISRELDEYERVRKHSDYENAEPHIRQLMKDYQEAIRRGDIDKIFSFYADDFVGFDCPPPLQVKGSQDYKESWEKYFISQFHFPLTYEIQDEKYFVADHIGFFHGLIHMIGTFKKNNQEVENWLRISCGLQKQGDQWKIVHEHVSVPVGEDMKALMNLKPNGQTEVEGP